MEQLDIKDSLSYYDCWLSKPTWTLDEAIGMLVRYHVLSRKWSDVDDINTVASSYHRHIYSMINKYLHEDELEEHVPDHIGSTAEDIELVYNKHSSMVTPKTFIKWAYAMKLDVPRECLEFVGEMKSNKLTYDYVNKMMCQAIAKTLWDMDSSLSIEALMWHSAIQKHAAGKAFADSVLRKWLSEVDPRPPESKPGPKRKTSAL